MCLLLHNVHRSNRALANRGKFHHTDRDRQMISGHLCFCMNATVCAGVCEVWFIMPFEDFDLTAH